MPDDFNLGSGSRGSAVNVGISCLPRLLTSPVHGQDLLTFQGHRGVGQGWEEVCRTQADVDVQYGLREMQDPQGELHWTNNGDIL